MTDDNATYPETAHPVRNLCDGDFTPIMAPEPLRYTVIPSEKNRETKTRRYFTGIEYGISALVHATPGATASRFAGSRANRTAPITRNKITSVKFLWTP
jgi:hypothetical protein